MVNAILGKGMIHSITLEIVKRGGVGPLCINICAHGFVVLYIGGMRGFEILTVLFLERAIPTR